MTIDSRPPSFENMPTPQTRISGKNGNAARLLVIVNPAATVAQSPEKISTRATHPASVTSPATHPAKNGNNIGKNSGKNSSNSESPQLTAYHHLSLPYQQPSSAYHSGKNSGKNSGNKSGKNSGKTSKTLPCNTIPGCIPLPTIGNQHKKRNRGKNGNIHRLPSHPSAWSSRHSRPLRFRQRSGNICGNTYTNRCAPPHSTITACLARVKNEKIRVFDVHITHNDSGKNSGKISGKDSGKISGNTSGNIQDARTLSTMWHTIYETTYAT